MIFAVTRKARVKGKTESRKLEGGEGGVWKNILAKNNDGRQTSSGVKLSPVGLVRGWVAIFKRKSLYWFM